MFPNDDICNVKAAKDAAKRIFQRYRMPVENNKTSDGLGSKQVSSLIKNAYSAINIAYDPSSTDVFSFMSVFGADESGKIELDKLQELAVKYLCGEEALVPSQMNKQTKETSKSLEKGGNNLQQKTQKKDKNAKKELNTQNVNYSLKNVNQNSSINLNQSNANIKSLKFLSPRVTQSKNYFSSKQNINGEKKQQVKKLTYSQILNQANQIFNDYKNRQKGGITINQAAEVLQKSYKMMGKSKFSPNQEDAKIWMKLCDMKKNGVIEWASYENFVKRLMERENIHEHQQQRQLIIKRSQNLQ